MTDVNTASDNEARRAYFAEQRKKREDSWRRFEQFQARRERVRLIKSGGIVPADRMKPQLLVKNELGQWLPKVG